MPELPEVQTIASDLDDIVGGRRIIQAAVAYPKIVAGDSRRFVDFVSGAKIEKVERFGKWIRFGLAGPAGPAAMLAHLKMTGQFQLGAWPEEGRAWPAHCHAAFQLSGLPPGQDALFYRDIRKFGRLRAFDPGELEEFLRALAQGPDPLTVSPDEFHRRLSARRGRLKAVLLDQGCVSGLGNIYVDESLFAAGLSPLAAADSLSRAETDLLLKEARRILKAAIEARGSTTSNYKGLKGGGSFQLAHQVYGRAGEPCPKCGAALTRRVVAGRTTHYCPHCQKVSAK
ncbi:MAG: bifunctional DNA-formamidopyrimidine glycosylase/DNA-(apurinic or apyrimidinic site) lyase [Candidatus Adiutrix sp.]|jgi:formamidopyrimidine-DNA glycosylase|nr:bifunctional DNA-formamidopyrimidine glycosylase/DNA-(apurinic or apyrimidinic site) lyase [Candidatus Adiutrix sp.]